MIATYYGPNFFAETLDAIRFAATEQELESLVGNANRAHRDSRITDGELEVLGIAARSLVDYLPI